MSESPLVAPYPAEQVHEIRVEGVPPPGVVVAVGHLVQLNRVAMAAQRARGLVVAGQILPARPAGTDDGYGAPRRPIEPAGKSRDAAEPREGRLLRVEPRLEEAARLQEEPRETVGIHALCMKHGER